MLRIPSFFWFFFFFAVSNTTKHKTKKKHTKQKTQRRIRFGLHKVYCLSLHNE